MTPGPAVFIACPMCETVHSFRGWTSRTIFERNVFSDLAKEIYTNATLAPDYVVCLQCKTVRPIGDFKEVMHSDKEKLPTLTAASRQQMVDALRLEPFCSDFYYGHNLRLHLFREDNRYLSAGLPVLDAALRQELLETLYMECHKLSSTPLYLHLTGEIERQQGQFEQAQQRFLNLMNQDEDLLVRHWAAQELQWCTEKRSQRRRLSMPPKPETQTRPVITARKGLKFVLVATQNATVRKNIAQWTTFPEILAEVQLLSNLTMMARQYDPVAGIVLVTREVKFAYPTADHFDAFLVTDLCLVKDVPILLVADSSCGDKYNRALRDALRKASFHIAAVDESALDFERFARWGLTHSRRAERRVRSIPKFQNASRPASIC